MQLSKKKAFTLVELLVVVLVLGALAGIATPKFKRMLETRKTGEAEAMLAAVRTEQEKRCISGKEYQNNINKIDALANASGSKNYTYGLTGSGARAVSKRGEYVLQMQSYKDGGICCSGSGCSKLNKNYPSCEKIQITDECAAEELEEKDLSACEGKEQKPSQEKRTIYNPKNQRQAWKTCTTTRTVTGCVDGEWQYEESESCQCTFVNVCIYEEQSWDEETCSCQGEVSCESNPHQKKCCTEDQWWTGSECKDKCTGDKTCEIGQTFDEMTCSCVACTNEQCCPTKNLSTTEVQWWDASAEKCRKHSCPNGAGAYTGMSGGKRKGFCCEKEKHKARNSAGDTVDFYSYFDGNDCKTGFCQVGEVATTPCSDNSADCPYVCEKDPNAGGGGNGGSNGGGNGSGRSYRWQSKGTGTETLNVTCSQVSNACFINRGDACDKQGDFCKKMLSKQPANGVTYKGCKITYEVFSCNVP